MRPLLLALLLGCASTTTSRDGSSPAEDDAPIDAAPDALPDVAPDAPATAECRAPVDCAARPTPASVRHCIGGGRWSCLAGRCTWGCEAALTCTDDGGRCLRCNAPAPACDPARCEAPPLDAARLEDATCTRPFHADAVSCAGPFVRLRDGMWCLVEMQPTGAIRAILSCGGCQTTLVW